MRYIHICAATALLFWACASPISAFAQGDADPGAQSASDGRDGGSDVADDVNDVNDGDAPGIAGDEDFGDTWEPEPGTGAPSDDGDPGGSPGASVGDAGGTAIDDRDETGMPFIIVAPTDNDSGWIKLRNGR